MCVFWDLATRSRYLTRRQAGGTRECGNGYNRWWVLVLWSVRPCWYCWTIGGTSLQVFLDEGKLSHEELEPAGGKWSVQAQDTTMSTASRTPLLFAKQRRLIHRRFCVSTCVYNITAHRKRLTDFNERRANCSAKKSIHH